MYFEEQMPLGMSLTYSWCVLTEGSDEKSWPNVKKYWFKIFIFQPSIFKRYVLDTVPTPDAIVAREGLGWDSRKAKNIDILVETILGNGREPRTERLG